MNHISQVVAAVVATLVLVSPVVAEAAPRSHPLDEEAALALLERTLKHDQRLYAPDFIGLYHLQH
jgi:hypothetical protein